MGSISKETLKVGIADEENDNQLLNKESGLDQIITLERKKVVKIFTLIANNYDKIIEHFPEKLYHTTFLSLTHKETKSGHYDTRKLLKMYLGLTRVLPEDKAHNLILEYTDKNHTTKTHQAIKAKFQRRKNFEEIKDFFRTTITRENDFQDTRDLFNEFTKTQQILDQFGFTVHEFKPKLKPGGYSDLSVIFENSKPDKTYFEVQYNNQKCLDIKNIETEYYNIKREIAAYFHADKGFAICLELYFRKLIYNDFDSPTDFGITFSEYKMFLIRLNSIQSDYNPKLVKNLEMLDQYKQAFVAGFELYKQTNPVIKDINSVKAMKEHYKDYQNQRELIQSNKEKLNYESKLDQFIKKTSFKP